MPVGRSLQEIKTFPDGVLFSWRGHWPWRRGSQARHGWRLADAPGATRQLWEKAMAIYIFSYELRRPGKDYTSLYTYLKQFTHCHHQTSTWFLDTTQTSLQIRDGAKGHVDANDTVFVGRLSQDWGTLNSDCADWLNNPARRW